MHVWITAGSSNPWLRISDVREEGAISADGRLAGCYIHGFFHSTAQRAAWLARLGAASNGMDHDQTINAALDELAQELETAIDSDALLALANNARSEEHTSELQSLMRISYAVFCLTKKKHRDIN